MPSFFSKRQAGACLQFETGNGTNLKSPLLYVIFLSCRTDLVIDPEALEGRLIQEFAPAAKRRRYCGVFSCEQGLLESDHGSLTDETVPATPQND